MSDRTFEFLLNAMEAAGRAERPAEHNYAARRQAVLEYVALLERQLASARPTPEPEPGSAAPPILMWNLVMPFRKDGWPLMLSAAYRSARRVLVIESDEWRRLCAQVPELATTRFKVGTDA